jgi:hypothetical protein
MPKSSCPDGTGVSIPGHCRGPKDNQCCISKENEDAATAKNVCTIDKAGLKNSGFVGECISTTNCKRMGGTSTPGFCPGTGNDIRVSEPPKRMRTRLVAGRMFWVFEDNELTIAGSAAHTGLARTALRACASPRQHARGRRSRGFVGVGKISNAVRRILRRGILVLSGDEAFFLVGGAVVGGLGKGYFSVYIERKIPVL